jgi:2-haloacid dehalogenase
MPAAQRPQAVALDVVETLVSLGAVGVALEDLGLGPDAVERLFTRLLRDGFALAASGAYRPFRDVADSALAAIAPALAASQREAVLAAFSRLDAHPDARPALEHLRRAGLAVAALTNGAAATTTTLLERTGLDALVDARAAGPPVASPTARRSPPPERHVAGDPPGERPGPP